MKRSSIGDIIDSNDDSTFTISENFFQYQMRQFFSKGTDLFIVWDFQLFNCVCEKGIRVFCIFSIFCKSFITFYEANFFCRLFFVRKKNLNRFPRVLFSISLSFKIRTNLLILYIRRYCYTLTVNFCKHLYLGQSIQE